MCGLAFHRSIADEVRSMQRAHVEYECFKSWKLGLSNLTLTFLCLDVSVLWQHEALAYFGVFEIIFFSPLSLSSVPFLYSIFLSICWREKWRIFSVSYIHSVTAVLRRVIETSEQWTLMSSLIMEAMRHKSPSNYCILRSDHAISLISMWSPLRPVSFMFWSCFEQGVGQGDL